MRPTLGWINSCHANTILGAFKFHCAVVFSDVPLDPSKWKLHNPGLMMMMMIIIIRCFHGVRW